MVDKQGELESIRIEVVDNGYTVACSYRAPKASSRAEKSCGPCSYEPPKTKVFESSAGVMRFLREKLNASGE